MRAADALDSERYLTVAFASEFRQNAQLPPLLMPGGAHEYAPGFSGERGDGCVWLHGGHTSPVAFVERDPYRPNLAVKFSRYGDASLDEIVASAASPTGSPLFDVQETDWGRWPGW
ncbi:hypothetical protein HNR05_001383 [Leifsonia psychrotolerans]|uniref:Uncharacterized protein n=2 Tax=Glaciibacter psychrotolerans TaxID=670054 RepID=A0A7Z0EER5_9MICO|nr:hypothetical protein [Leifsonia psychrotolerans]